MLLLAYARLLIAVVPLRFWRDRLGLGSARAGLDAPQARAQEARRLARHVERGAARFPVRLKCLPRAVALSLLLRRARIAHSVVFAVRPRAHRGAGDRLHVWVEHEGALLIGDLPGPWLTILRLGNVSI